jgi:hypothetical protein
LLLVEAAQKPFGSSSSLTTSAPVSIKAVSAENCIPVITFRLHQGLIADYEHLTCRSQGWPPHRELDEHFDSIEEAWSYAICWWQQQQPAGEPATQVGLGLDVSTVSGSWRIHPSPPASLNPA